MPVTDLAKIFKAYDVRGLYGDDIDGDTAEAVGRGLARALADLSGKARGELRIGLGRDMRLSAPELAARYRDGLIAEGAHVVDAGMVGTEMLYWLVGSRDLDGGLMCTASPQPEGLHRRQDGRARLASRCPATAACGEVRAHIENGLGEAPGGGSFEEVDIYEDFQRDALEVIDPSAIQPLKVVARRRQRHGRADDRPDPRPAPARAGRDLLGPRRRVPRPRAEPAAAREPRVHHRARCSRPAPTSASPGTATPTAASSSTAPASSSPATSSPRCSPPPCSRRPRRRHPLRRPRLAGGAGHRRRGSAAAP